MRLLSRPARLVPALLGLLLAIALVPVLAGPARAATIVLSGKVTGLNASGVTVPVQDVFVEVDDSQGNPLPDRAYDYTAADGTYQITVPAAGTYRITMECWGAYACAAEYAPEPFVTRTISASLVTDATLERWGRITGTVKKSSVAIAWPAGEIEAWNDPRGYWRSAPVKADANGRFTIDKVAPGTVSIVGREPYDVENFLSSIDGQTVNVTPGQTSDISLAVEDWPGIHARAVDPANGQPLSGMSWNVFSRPVGGAWDAGLQYGPLVTGDDGTMSYRITDKTREYTVCFADNIGSPVRRETRCLGGASSPATATAWKHTAAQPKLKTDVGLPYAFTTAPTPTITGTAKVGATLTASAGTWSPSASVAYQWLRAGVAITGATASTYAPVVEDLGKVLTVRVTGTRPGYVTTAKTSAATAAVVAGDFTSTPAPIISGTTAVGSTLTANVPAWTPSATTTTYQWLREGAVISGATSPKYDMVAADLGKRIAVRVTGARSGYASVTKTSASTAQVASATFGTVPTPTISGAAVVGAILTATAGTWVPAATTTGYQWFRSGVAIPGATAATYQVTAADAGATLTVRVTGERDGYAATEATSAATAAVEQAAFTQTSVPKIKGKAKVRAKLKVVVGTWSPTPATTTYQWYRNGKAIKGATEPVYKVTTKDRRKRITVVVAQSLPGHATVSQKSAATKRVR